MFGSQPPKPKVSYVVSHQPMDEWVGDNSARSSSNLISGK